MNRKLLLSFCFLLFSFPIMAQPGTLDETFNGTGIKEKTLYKNLASETIYASVLQSDGKLLVVGSQKLNTQEEGFVARFLSNGSFDPTFGEDGVFLTGNITTGLSNFIPKAIALDDLGGGAFDIVLAGYSIPSEQVACVVKLKQNGTHVTGFGASGYYATAPVSLKSAVFNTVQVHAATHNIIVAGTDAVGATTGDYLVASLTSAGALIYSNAIPVASNTGNFDEALCSVMYHADSIYLGGVSKDAITPFKEHFSIVAMNVLDGTVETSSILPLSSPSLSNDRCTAIAVASDGKVVLAGRTFNGSTIETMVYRLRAISRLPDSGTFGTSGFKTFDFSPGFSENLFSMCLDTNNDIVLGGNIVVSGGETRWNLSRINYASTLQDAAFHLTSIEVAQNRGIASIHRLSTGKYVLVGETYDITSAKTDGLFKRVNSDGSDDIEKAFWVSNANSVFYDAAIDANGKIWVCGNIEESKVFSGQTAFIARFNADGSLDASFTDSDPYTENGIQIIQASAISSGAYALEILSTGKVLVAGSSSAGALGKDFFLTRLNYDGTTDVTFNSGSSTPGRFQLDFYGGDDEVADIALQGNKILLYGYAESSSLPPIKNLTMIRVNANGTFDNTFRPSNALNQFVYANSDASDLFFKLKVQSDNKIVGVGADGTADRDMLVFRLLDTGEDDPSFNGDGYFTCDFYGGSDYASCLFIRPDGRILVGGQAERDFAVPPAPSNERKIYAMFQLRSNGTFDPTFASSAVAPLQAGQLTFDKGFKIQGFTGVYMEDGNHIVAVGFNGSQSTSIAITAVRYYQNGVFDNTFGNSGYANITLGLPYGSFMSGDRLYTLGCRNQRPNPYPGLITKIKLGVTTVATNMVMSDVNKTYGDANFIMRASSNSPANITYSVLSGTCATIDASTGEVSITCAGPVNTVTIRAIQPALTNFTADTVDAVITIAKATPVISFKNQGAIIGEVFSLQAESNTDATPVFSQSSGFSFLTIDAAGESTVLAEGSATVAVSYAATDNYLPASAVAEIYGYIIPVRPKASDDEMILVFGINTDTLIYVLANDTGYTGQIVPELTDLDPETSGIQNTFASPSLGAFFVDESGIVQYVPFQGFIGTGEISYTVQDTRGDVSLPAKIKVTVNNPTVIPALKATELFTPNGDGLNEAFVIGYINPDKPNQLKVFDRNGGELFNQTNYKNDWQGLLSNGTRLANGTYYYLFTEGSGSDKRELSGFIEIKN